MNRLLFFLIGFVLMACKSDASPRKVVKNNAILGQVSPTQPDLSSSKDKKGSSSTKKEIDLQQKPDLDITDSGDAAIPKKHPISGSTEELYDLRHPEGSVRVDENNQDESDIKEASPNHTRNPQVKDKKQVLLEDSTESPETEDTNITGHSIWNGLLSKYVSASGSVNYEGLKEDHEKLRSYLALLAEEIPNDSWRREKALAYWINVYNAFTVDLIVSNYPLSSITSLDNGNPWEKKRVKLAGKNYSLNNIEHDIIRPQFNDARIHFAVNCAARSCPKLLNTAWTENNLEKNLERLTQEFINSPNHNKIQKTKASLSKIFEWYKDDFGDLVTFVNQYSAVKIAEGAVIEYMDYNWSLNGN